MKRRAPRRQRRSYGKKRRMSKPNTAQRKMRSRMVGDRF